MVTIWSGQVIISTLIFLLYTQTCDEDGLVINTSHFAPGVYAISIKSQSLGTVVKRFTVVH